MEDAYSLVRRCNVNNNLRSGSHTRFKTLITSGTVNICIPLVPEFTLYRDSLTLGKLHFLG